MNPNVATTVSAALLVASVSVLGYYGVITTDQVRKNEADVADVRVLLAQRMELVHDVRYSYAEVRRLNTELIELRANVRALEQHGHSGDSKDSER